MSKFRFTLGDKGISYSQIESFNRWRLHCHRCGRDEYGHFTYADTVKWGDMNGWQVGAPYADDLCPNCQPKQEAHQECQRVEAAA